MSEALMRSCVNWLMQAMAGPPSPWDSGDPRGRWVVRGAARGRRFSSLSRARAFALKHAGTVERYRARKWRKRSHWECMATRVLAPTVVAYEAARVAHAAALRGRSVRWHKVARSATVSAPAE